MSNSEERLKKIEQQMEQLKKRKQAILNRERANLRKQKNKDIKSIGELVLNTLEIPYEPGNMNLEHLTEALTKLLEHQIGPFHHTEFYNREVVPILEAEKHKKSKKEHSTD